MLRHASHRRGLRHRSGSFPAMQTTPVLQANPKDPMQSNEVLHDPTRFDVDLMSQNHRECLNTYHAHCLQSNIKGNRISEGNSLAGPLGLAAVNHSFSIVLCKPFRVWLTSVQGNFLSPSGHFLARQQEPVHPSPAGCHGE